MSEPEFTDEMSDELETALDENAAEVADALETLVRLQRTGTLDELAALADAVTAATAAVDDEMVASVAGLAERLGELADDASDPDTAAGIGLLLDAVGEANRAPPEKVGPAGLVRSLRDPAVQYGLGYLLTLAGALGRGVARKHVRERERAARDRQ